MNFNRKHKIFLIFLWVSIFGFTSVLDRIGSILFGLGSLISFLLTPTLLRILNNQDIIQKQKKIIKLRKELEKLENATSRQT